MSFIQSLVRLGFFCTLLISTFSNAQEEKKESSQEAEKGKCPTQEEFSETKHQIIIDGKPVDYRAVAGTLLLKDEKCDPKASIFFISYTKENVDDPSERPITFCFNGGPGSSSVWLHLGVLGPKRVFLNENGDALPPYHLVDNEFSLLDTTDLVFIDPVSTGYSRAIPPEDAKNYHGVEEDVKSIADFIRLYMTRYNRWESPKFIVGESYGTTRAAALAGYLHDRCFIYTNGLVLISSVLNFQSIDFSAGNDLSYLLFFPTYTATAWYHRKLSQELQADFQKTLQEAKDFVTNEYSVALFKGDTLPLPEKNRVISQMARLTGLSPAYIEQCNMRVDIFRFAKELLRSQKRTVGRFDSRFKGIESDAAGDRIEYDPSADAIFGAFTSTFNHYIKTNLKWERDGEYKILTNVQPWKYGAENQYLNVSESLREVMTKNGYQRTFVGSGYYDLATPFFATDYTFDHLGLDPILFNHITMKTYEGGHMMYIYRPSLIQLKKDLADFYKQTLSAQLEEETKSESVQR